MEFWGVEVPAGKPTSCSPGDGMYLHVSQAALGESNDKSGKGNARVVLKVEVDASEVLLGTLSEGRCDQMPLDLVFDREFIVSHNSTSSSVYLCGYRTEGSPEEEDSEDEDEEEDEDDEEEAPVPVAVPIASNGAAAGKQPKEEKVKILVKATDKVQLTPDAVVKVEKKSVKKQVVESSSDEEDESDDEEDEDMGHPFVSDLASESDDEFDAGDDDSDEDMDDDEDDDDDEDESDESEEEELKVEAPKAAKKRQAEELTKSAEKKSKTAVSAKPERGVAGKEAAAEYWQSLIAAGSKGQSPASGKKGGKAGPVTPVGKAAAPAEVKTPTVKTPKGTPTAPPTTPVSDKKFGQHKCTGCERMFTTESAMTQHAVAKHK